MAHSLRDEISCCLLRAQSLSHKVNKSLSHVRLCDFMDCRLPGSRWSSLGQNTGVGGHSLLQGIFPTQGWNPFPSPGDLSSPGIEPRSPALQVDSLLSEPPGKPSDTQAGLQMCPADLSPLAQKTQGSHQQEGPLFHRVPTVLTVKLRVRPPRLS